MSQIAMLTQNTPAPNLKESKFQVMQQDKTRINFHFETVPFPSQRDRFAFESNVW